ncbi:galactose ABC transporter substrate-binding protein [Blautia sp. Marseille-P3201T]|uniref:galactose ABC transporter substrate-binding protein n=1 Tax=Blautia sp. Marseille-P3201T TaxID=1907659 RepID=UPI0009300971|nr:galactose ABC transporter substrate-binding protein [Blautia sp. Marseille-P3201T]
MKKRKTAGLGILLGMTALLFCGCKEKEIPEKLHVGITYYDQSDTYMNELIGSIKESLKETENDKLEVTVTIRDAAGLQKNQNDQVEELLDEGCNILCVNLVDRADPSEIIDFAREREVPIIFFNREPVAEDLHQWDKLYYVGADAKQSGKLQGELAVDLIKENSQIDKNKDGKIQYVVLEGEMGHQDAIIRTENAVNTLKENGIEVEKLSCKIANWKRAQAQNRMEQIIGEYQNKIELVLSNNDEMALGAVDAYKKLNYTSAALPVFLGIDGTEIGLQAVEDGELWGTVYNDKKGQADAIAKLATALITGEGMEDISFKNERYVYLPYYKVTAENLAEFRQGTFVTK